MRTYYVIAEQFTNESGEGWGLRVSDHVENTSDIKTVLEIKAKNYEDANNKLFFVTKYHYGERTMF